MTLDSGWFRVAALAVFAVLATIGAAFASLISRCFALQYLRTTSVPRNSQFLPHTRILGAV